ncbi:hypothetical protein [Gryllotalpicola ginsengisoli]|uniref:hypothetical protein n=1 Tax=Gryllotalpicola ginsengisoli TaxID=444608 RepID=UPI0003B4DD39|nr:hypothetical protein [Gryllotalpicola ginsengisoli]
MSEAKPLVSLGDPDAVVCAGDVCEVPQVSIHAKRESTSGAAERESTSGAAPVDSAAQQPNGDPA